MGIPRYQTLISEPRGNPPIIRIVAGPISHYTIPAGDGHGDVRGRWSGGSSGRADDRVEGRCFQGFPRVSRGFQGFETAEDLDSGELKVQVWKGNRPCSRFVFEA